MGKPWILDTSTKGTGATMVPLESVLRKPAERAEPIYVPPPRRAKPPAPAEPRRPRSFKIVDLSTRQVLSEGVNAGAAIEVLNDVRSIIDVNIYVWQPEPGNWRLLTLREQRLLWERRASEGRGDRDTSGGSPGSAKVARRDPRRPPASG